MVSQKSVANCSHWSSPRSKRPQEFFCCWLLLVGDHFEDHRSYHKALTESIFKPTMASKRIKGRSVVGCNPQTLTLLDLTCICKTLSRKAAKSCDAVYCIVPDWTNWLDCSGLLPFQWCHSICFMEQAGSRIWTVRRSSLVTKSPGSGRTTNEMFMGVAYTNLPKGLHHIVLFCHRPACQKVWVTRRYCLQKTWTSKTLSC